MNDLQTLIVTLFLGGITYWVVRYLARIFSKASVPSSGTTSTSDNGNANQRKRKVTPEKTEHAENKNQAAVESKVKLSHIWTIQVIIHELRHGYFDIMFYPFAQFVML